MGQGGHLPGGGYPPPDAPPPEGYGGYAPPPGYGYPPPADYATAWSPTAAISFAWKRIESDPWGIAGPLAVGLIILLSPNLLSTVFANPARFERGVPLAGLPLIARFAPLLHLLLAAYLQGGITTFALNVARGEHYQFSDIFGGTRYFGAMFVVTFLSEAGVGLGLLLLVVPGIVLALGWSLSYPLVVDRHLGAVDALRESWRLMDGQKSKMLVFALISAALFVVGLCACFVGLIVVLPLLHIALCWIYLKITGQRTLDG
jgi:uncharacterized membrane protein